MLGIEVLDWADIAAYDDDPPAIKTQGMPGRTHGKRSTYKTGCRCAACTRANRNYHRPRMRDRQRRQAEERRNAKVGA